MEDLTSKTIQKKFCLNTFFKVYYLYNNNIWLGWMCSRDTRSCCRRTPGQPGCSQESVHGQDGDKELQDTQDQCDQLLGPR